MISSRKGAACSNTASKYRRHFACRCYAFFSSSLLRADDILFLGRLEISSSTSPLDHDGYDFMQDSRSEKIITAWQQLYISTPSLARLAREVDWQKQRAQCQRRQRRRPSRICFSAGGRYSLAESLTRARQPHVDRRAFRRDATIRRRRPAHWRNGQCCQEQFNNSFRGQPERQRRTRQCRPRSTHASRPRRSRAPLHRPPAGG